MLKKNPALLIKRYAIVSFFLLFCVISAYQVVIFVHTWTQKNDAYKVNTAGRQRMLSQRIGKNLAFAVAAGNNLKQRNQFIALTVSDIHDLAVNHVKLKTDAAHSSLFLYDKNIKANFIAIEKPLAQMVLAVSLIENNKNSTSLSEQQQANISQALAIYSRNDPLFLDLMEQIVKSYEVAVQNYVDQLLSVSWIGAGFVLLVMFINGRFVVFKSIKEIEALFAEIKNHKEFQETILSCSLDGIISINSSNCITLMNKTAEKLFLGSQRDFLGKRITTIIPEFPFDLLATIENDCVLELECRKRGAILFPALINISKIETQSSKGWVIFVNNLSLKKSIEKELTQAQKQLTDAVEANHAKSQFVANISHELKTPLNAIIGFAQLLETDHEAPLSGEHLDYVNYIHQSGTHLLTLINEILDFAQLENGQLSVSLEMVNISKVVKEAVMLIYTAATKRHLSIINQFDVLPDYFIIVDRIRMKQVLLNFLSNAVKYNNDGGSIEITAETKDNQCLKISITDSGKGIASHKISQLFDPFNRLGAENSDIEGTGIGLTITKRLVEDMDGEIGVLSEENKGSTFWVEFPLAENHQQNL